MTQLLYLTRLDKSFIFICFDIMHLIDRNCMPSFVEDMCTEAVDSFNALACDIDSVINFPDFLFSPLV